MPRKRPYLPGGRPHGLLIRLSDAERAAVEKAARKADLTLRGFVAEAAVLTASGRPGGAVPGELREAGAQLMQTRTQLARVGTNLNQAVARLNATGDPPPTLGPAILAVGVVVAEVREAIAAVVALLPR